MATQYDPTIFGYQNFFSALLTSDITSGSLTIAVDTVPSATSGILVVDPDSATNREVIFYTSKGASNIVCPSDGRGWAGSTATSHLTGTTVIMADVAQYFIGLSDGTLSTDPLRTAAFVDFVVSGGVVAQSAGLVGTFSNIVFYRAGRRYSGSSIANKTYTASKDTYVDITGNTDGSVTVLYTEVANGAASPALTTNYVRIAKVITSGSAITSVVQSGVDSVTTSGQLNYIYNTSPTASPTFVGTNAGTAGGTYFYKSQNGVKELWGNTNSVASGSWGITYPVGLFTAVQFGSINAEGGYTSTNSITANWAGNITSSPSSTSFTSLIIAGASPSNPFTYLIRGV